MPSTSPTARYLTNLISRRELLSRSAAGFAGLALSSLLMEDAARSETAAGRPAGTHFPPKAKAVIQLFQHGGPSHMDLLDPKSNYNRLWTQYIDEFGDEDDAVVVVEGSSREQVVPVLEELSDALARDASLFHAVLHEVDLGKIRSKGLHYLSPDELVGIVSDRDLARPTMVAGPAWRQVLVSDAMSRKPYAVPENTPLNKVARDMARRRIGSAVVMDGKKIAGIFTSVDALRALADSLEGKHARLLGEELGNQPPRGRTRPTASPRARAS